MQNETQTFRGNNQFSGKNLEDRFWEKVRINKSGCMLWIGAINSSGYGQILIHGKSTNAARLSYEINIGKIKKDLHVLHKFDVRNCVNPKHLTLGTNADNVKDRVKKNRSGGAKGEINYKAKLNKKQVLKIKSLARGQTKKLSEKYGVDRTTIQRIQRGKYWRHLND